MNVVSFCLAPFFLHVFFCYLVNFFLLFLCTYFMYANSDMAEIFRSYLLICFHFSSFHKSSTEREGEESGERNGRCWMYLRKRQRRWWWYGQWSGADGRFFISLFTHFMRVERFSTSSLDDESWGRAKKNITQSPSLYIVSKCNCMHLMLIVLYVCYGWYGIKENYHGHGRKIYAHTFCIYFCAKAKSIHTPYQNWFQHNHFFTSLSL